MLNQDRYHAEEHKGEGKGKNYDPSPQRSVHHGGYDRQGDQTMQESYDKQYVDNKIEWKRAEADVIKMDDDYKSGKGTKTTRENKQMMEDVHNAGSIQIDFATLNNKSEKEIAARRSDVEMKAGMRAGRRSDKGPSFKG